MFVHVGPVVRRNPWLALRLSRPQVIQTNAVSVVMATYVLHTTSLQQEKRECLDWQMAGKQRKSECAVWSPLIWRTTTTEIGHSDNQGSTWLLFINHRDRFNVISVSGRRFDLCTEQHQKMDILSF